MKPLYCERPIYEACKNNNYKMAKLYLQNGAKVDMVDEESG